MLKLMGIVALAASLIVVACDEVDGKAPLNGSADGLVGDPTTAPTADDIIGNDGPSPTVAARWTDFVPGGTATVSTLGLELENLTTSTDYTVTVTIKTEGLLNKSADLSLGDIDLAAGQTVTLSVPASQLPIQSTIGASMINVELMLTYENEGGVFSKKRAYSSFYYRHNPGYGSVKIFDEQKLISAYQGKIAGVPAGAQAAGGMLGRIANGSGGFNNVMLSDESLAHKVGADTIGRLVGMDIEIGEDVVPAGDVEGGEL